MSDRKTDQTTPPGKLTPDPKKGSDGSKPQQQRNFVPNPREKSD
ncbi:MULTISPECIES: hypothetical protein [Pacificimonas]|nr:MULTISPECIES: hypothetical protein [Pacificimonas]